MLVQYMLLLEKVSVNCDICNVSFHGINALKVHATMMHNGEYTTYIY